MTRIKLTNREMPEDQVTFTPATARAAGQTVSEEATEEVNYFCLAAWKGALKMEKVGLKSSGGAIRPRIAARLGLKARDKHDVFIARIEVLLKEILAEKAQREAI